MFLKDLKNLYSFSTLSSCEGDDTLGEYQKLNWLEVWQSEEMLGPVGEAFLLPAMRAFSPSVSPRGHDTSPQAISLSSELALPELHCTHFFMELPGVLPRD